MEAGREQDYSDEFEDHRDQLHANASEDGTQRSESQPQLHVSHDLDLAMLAQLRMTDEMKSGYASELEARKGAIDSAKASLEAWYGKRLEEKDIVGDERAQYDVLMAASDTTMKTAQGTMSTVKKDLAPCCK